MQTQTHDPVIHIRVNELILALRLDHVVSLLAETPDNAKDGKFGHVCKRVTSLLDVVVHSEHRLLQVVDSCECSCSTDTCTAVQDYFVVHGDICKLLSVKHAFSAPLAPVMHSEMLNDRLDNLVVLLLGCPEIWPRQILQLRNNPTVNYLTIGVLLSQLKPSLDQVGHEAFNRNQEHFFVIVKWNALNRLILPDLSRPILMALHLGVLF